MKENTDQFAKGNEMCFWLGFKTGMIQMRAVIALPESMESSHNDHRAL